MLGSEQGSPRRDSHGTEGRHAGAPAEWGTPVIRRCRHSDFGAVHAIINDAAEAYRGVIPADRWHNPYMPEDKLQGEIDAGGVFWGAERDGVLAGVMGLQDVVDVTLIRHAYVRPADQRRGVGEELLRALAARTAGGLLIGTWAAAVWAIGFYEKHGFRLVGPEDKDRLLKTYWSVPDRQVETSVVLANRAWWDAQRP